MAVRPGRSNLITDVAGITVGSAHDSLRETGATVIRPLRRSVAAAMVAGGGPGTRETDALAPDGLVDEIDAIVLSGGSVYGLAAADGVAAVLGRERAGFSLQGRSDVPVSPIVPAAILYDLANGGDKNWSENPPYRDLGIRALNSCGPDFDLGRTGAAFGARAGSARGGLGSASAVSSDGLEVGALVAVNAFGSVFMPGTDVFWAWPFEQNGEFGGKRPPSDYGLDLDDWGGAKQAGSATSDRVNTTLGCVAVNVALTPAEARRVAKMAMSGLSRAIRPVFAPFDGDVVFCLSTAEVTWSHSRPLLLARLGELAAACVARAVARGVWEAR
jgi:L-aminopeptidase/D-esterase-like protein